MEEKKKNQTGLIIFLIIVILGLIGFIIYDKLLVKDDNIINNVQGNDTVNESETINEIESLEVTDINVVKALEVLNKLHLFDKNIFTVDKYDIKNITKEELILMSAINSGKAIASCIFDQEREEVSIEYLNDIIKNYFIEDYSITLNDIKNLEKSNGTDIDYWVNENADVNDSIGIKIVGDKLQLYSKCGSEGPKSKTSYFTTKAEKTNDIIYVYRKVIFQKPEIINDDIKYQTYKDYNYSENVEVIDSYNYEKYDNYDLEKYDTYKYTFKIVDDNIYLQTIELDK